MNQNLFGTGKLAFPFVCLLALAGTMVVIWMKDAHALYKCHDASGAIIFSDSQAQLKECRSLANDPAPGVPTYTSTSSGSSGAQAASLGPAMSPPRPTASIEPIPTPLDLPFQQAGISVPTAPEAPTPSQSAELPPAASATEPPTVPTGENSPPCAPALNPLNPLSVQPCPKPGASPSAEGSAPTNP